MTESSTRTFRATAPGKLIIVGEYAVLEGATAISAAVDRLAVVDLSAVAGQSQLRIANTGCVYTFSVSGGRIDWRTDPGIYGDVLVAAVAALDDNEASIRGLPPLQIELCTRQFYTGLTGDVQKIGIGSSAALTVAVVAALRACAGATPTLRHCLAAHRILQHGNGSGVDIATSWYGGVIAVRPDAVAPAVESLDWPEGLHLRPVWSGNAASTPAMLARLQSFRQSNPQVYSSLMSRLADCAAGAQDSWRAANSADLCRMLHDYGQLLRALDENAGIGIWSKGHQHLLNLARKLGVGYKPSGAGGGDFGLAFSLDAERLDEFFSQVNASLVPQPVELQWSRDGLKSGWIAAR